MVETHDIAFAHQQKERFGYKIVKISDSATEQSQTTFADAPVFNAEPWNIWPAFVCNNCYAYAVNHNVRRSYAPYPGESVDKDWGKTIQKSATFTDFIEAIVRGAKMDGLKQMGQELPTQEGYYAIALFATKEVIAPRCARKPDFHWMRQNTDGTWSHKGGTELAHLVLDDNDTPIRDVCRVRMVTDKSLSGNENIDYAYEFVSYFLVPKGGIRVGIEALRAPTPNNLNTLAAQRKRLQGYRL